MSPAHNPRHVAIVGNAPILADQGGWIDAADWVVRINNASGFERRAGRRVTHLALVNHGGQMREWLEDVDFIHRPSVRQARSFLFPFSRKPGPAPDSDKDGRDWTGEAEALLAPLGMPVRVMPRSVHREAAAILRTLARPEPVPSTGFLVALHLLRTLAPGIRLDAHGFGFEGWSGHVWGRERGWFEAMADAGRMRLHALDACLGA